MLHPLQIYDVDFAVRIFLAGQYIENINPSIHKIIQLGPGPSPVQSEPVIIPFEFDSIRVAGIRFNMDYLRFDEMAWGSRSDTERLF